jgi:hypothetical protein
LPQGDELVADGIVFEASSLTANEAALTGESDDIKKNPKTAPFVFSGTQIMDGVGKYVPMYNAKPSFSTCNLDGSILPLSERTTVQVSGLGHSLPFDMACFFSHYSSLCFFPG